MKDTQKRQIAGRISEIIQARVASVTGFRTAAKAAGLSELHSNSRFWLPQPTGAWNWDRATKRWVGKKGRDAESDWEAVRIPSGKSLVQFCNFTNASADYILFGTGSPYRDVVRLPPQLETDLAHAAWRRLRERGATIPDVTPWINPGKLLEAAVDAVQAELAILSRQVAEEEPLIDAIDAISGSIYRERKVSPATREEWKVMRAALISLARQRHLPTSVLGSGRLAISTSDRSDSILVNRIITMPKDGVLAPQD